MLGWVGAIATSVGCAAFVVCTRRYVGTLTPAADEQSPMRSLRNFKPQT